ncbi:hypothetical protein TPA0909_27010 [Streptomyces albus]|nr:hypothetical protein TPA0909_27010 [Streptomyces albus]
MPCGCDRATVRAAGRSTDDGVRTDQPVSRETAATVAVDLGRRPASSGNPPSRTLRRTGRARNRVVHGFGLLDMIAGRALPAPRSP